MKTVVVIIATALCSLQYSCNANEGEHAFIYPEDYKKHEAPIPNMTIPGQKPLTILVHMDVWTISEISLLRQDMEVDLIMTIYWNDDRLIVNHNITIDDVWLRLGEESFEVWRPTLMFRNCKGCQPLNLGVSVPMFVHKITAQFWSQERVLTRFSCAINLRAYPMDIQNCVIQLYTNERGQDILNLDHSKPEKYIQTSSGVTLSEFYIPSIEKSKCLVQEASGAFVSCMELRIKFIRLIAYHLMTSYFPTTFIVILSWISFWLPVDAVPARIALGLTSLLTLATRLDQAQANLPPVSYVKAIDVWMFACISMVSLSLLEFAVSYYRVRQNELKETSGSIKAAVIPARQIQPYPVKKDSSPSSQKPLLKHLEKDGTFLDRSSRIIFPLFFTGFNIVYWSYFLTYYK